MKKQLLAILLIASVIFTFCGCKENSDQSSSLSTTMSNIPESSSEVSTSFVSSTQSIESQSSDKPSSSSNLLSQALSSTSSPFSISFVHNGPANNPFIVLLGDSMQIGTLYRPRSLNEAASITWSYKISDESVVRIAKNEITNKPSFSERGCTVEALKPGTATISATWYCNGESSSSSFIVKVIKPEDIERSFSFADGGGLLIEIGSGLSRFVSMNYSYGFFSIKDEEYKLEIKSSDETIARASYKEKPISERISASDGIRVYGINPGDASITVTIYVGDKSITDTCYIRVKEVPNNPSGLASSFASSS